jgi:NAD-dependent deacetylase
MLVAMDDVALARDLVSAASRIVALVGAGISTDSGIADFRGPNGVWTKNPAAEKTSQLHFYLSDPEVRKNAWRNRLSSPIWDAQPNPGHLALVELERQGKLEMLVTQNIDGLHHAAGNDRLRVVEIHGNAREVICWSCGERAPMEKALARVRAGEEDPPCRTCGGILKSATISFGQQLVAEDLVRSEDAATRCNLLLAVGSSLGVYPAAGLVPIAMHHGARLVVVNAEPTPYDEVADAVVRGQISEVLPEIVRGARPPQPASDPA